MPRRSFQRFVGRRSHFSLAVAVLTTAAAAPITAHAQAIVATSTADSAVSAPAAAPPALGPTLDGARAGATRVASAAPLTVADPVPGPRAGRPVALMVVGGAALILGAIIGGSGGTAVAIGGTVVGLVGLYQFIR